MRLRAGSCAAGLGWGGVGWGYGWGRVGIGGCGVGMGGWGVGGGVANNRGRPQPVTVYHRVFSTIFGVACRQCWPLDLYETPTQPSRVLQKTPTCPFPTDSQGSFGNSSGSFKKYRQGSQRNLKDSRGSNAGRFH